MKLNLEIDLDWIDEEKGLDETVKEQIIEGVVSKVQKNLGEKVEQKINSIIDTTIVDRINSLTDEVFDDFVNKEVCLSDKWGDKIKCYPTLKDLLKERFDNFLTQTVDEKGNSYDGNYGQKFTRITFIIDKQLKDFANKFTTDAVKQVSDEIKVHVKEGLTTKLGAELMNVLKVNEMLQLPTK